MASSEQRRIGRRRRAARVRRSVRGTDARPRVSVFRSNKHLYVQVVSDESGRTLASASTLGGAVTGANIESAKGLGKAIADQCKQLSVETVVFDRNGYKYHGRVKAIADAAREAGLKL